MAAVTENQQILPALVSVIPIYVMDVETRFAPIMATRLAATDLSHKTRSRFRRQLVRTRRWISR
jgi:hypothetical protein